MKHPTQNKQAMDTKNRNLVQSIQISFSHVVWKLGWQCFGSSVKIASSGLMQGEWDTWIILMDAVYMISTAAANGSFLLNKLYPRTPELFDYSDQLG